MSADVVTPLNQDNLSKLHSATSPTSATSKVDSAIEDGDHVGESYKPRRRTSSTVTGVFSIAELGKLDLQISDTVLTVYPEKENIDLAVAPETQKLNWKINTSPNTIEDREYLQKLLISPPIKKMDLRFSLGLVVTARNLKGVTIKDACDAIYKQYKKKTDDELTEGAYLKGFEWDRDENYSSLLIHTKMNADVVPNAGKRKKSRSGSVAEAVPE